MDAEKRCRKEFAGAATGFRPAGPGNGKSLVAEATSGKRVAAWRKDFCPPRVHFAPVVVSDAVEEPIVLTDR
jgi:hypothetical protein